jgi:hypothetical protein
MQQERGGRPRRRGDARRATRLRVARVAPRREQYEIDRGKAQTLNDEISAASDYLRSALKRNRTSITPGDEHTIRDLLEQLAGHGHRIYARAATQANTDANTPRRRTA